MFCNKYLCVKMTYYYLFIHSHTGIVTYLSAHLTFSTDARPAVNLQKNALKNFKMLIHSPRFSVSVEPIVIRDFTNKLNGLAYGL